MTDRRDPTLLINILAPKADMTTADITGDRTNHPRHGAHSDIMVVIGGEQEGPFGYYADAYAFAAARVAPEQITRNGRVARKPASKR